MYVCNCNALRERDVRPILENVVEGPAEVHRALGCRPRCGRCLKDIQAMIDQAVRTAAVAAE
jgi:bacterioferritin-associated ferredoxin